MTEYPEQFWQLYQAATNVIREAGFRLSRSADGYLILQTRQAIERLESGDIPDNVSPIDSFETFGWALVRIQSDYPPASDPHRIDDATVERALAKYCPLWPFC